MIVSEAISQMYFHEVKSKTETLGFFKKILTGFLEANLNDNLIDSNLIGLLISDCIDIELRELLPLIKQLYEKGYVNEMIVINYEEVEAGFDNPRKLKKKKELLNVFQIYQHYEEVFIKESDTEVDDFDDFDDSDDFDMVEEVQPQERFIESTSKPITVNKVGRNDPCPCGSGKKYKKCCME